MGNYRAEIRAHGHAYFPWALSPIQVFRSALKPIGRWTIARKNVSGVLLIIKYDRIRFRVDKHSEDIYFNFRGNRVLLGLLTAGLL